MAEVLLIDRPGCCTTLVRRALNHPETNITIYSNLSDAREVLFGAGSKAQFDLIFLSLELGQTDSLMLLNEIQESPRTLRTPTYLLSCSNDTLAKVAAFNAGADDFIHDSIDPIELRARVEMRLRKISSFKKAPTKFQFGDLRICVDSHEVELDTLSGPKILRLTNKEFGILHLLAKEGGRALSRAEIVNQVWGKNVHVLDRTVDSHICSLRRKLGSAASCLEAIAGAGYRLTKPIVHDAGTMELR